MHELFILALFSRKYEENRPIFHIYEFFFCFYDKYLLFFINYLFFHKYLFGLHFKFCFFQFQFIYWIILHKIWKLCPEGLTFLNLNLYIHKNEEICPEGIFNQMKKLYLKDIIHQIEELCPEGQQNADDENHTHISFSRMRFG